MRHLVWSRGTRLLHATLAISMIASFATHEIDGAWHEWPGYVALAAALVRLAWGMLPATRQAPARYTRFADFLRSPQHVWQHLRAVLRRQEPRYLGHSPLAGYLVLALLVVSAAAGISGWMLTLDRFFGIAWVMQAHELSGHAILPLVLLHWVALAYGSWRRRENLLVSMLHGGKVVRTRQT